MDKAETPEGRVTAWKANATGPALLARTCAEHGITLVHVSSDYVFDGTAEVHTEDESLSPLSVHGQTKAAGDIAVVAACATTSCAAPGSSARATTSSRPQGLSDRVADPEDGLEQVTVVDDQLGRLDLHARHGRGHLPRAGDARPLRHLRLHRIRRSEVLAWTSHAPSSRPPTTGRRSCRLTADYYANAAGPVAPRPVHSALDLSKLESTGFHMPDWEEELGEYSPRRSSR